MIANQNTRQSHAWLFPTDRAKETITDLGSGACLCNSVKQSCEEPKPESISDTNCWRPQSSRLIHTVGGGEESDKAPRGKLAQSSVWTPLDRVTTWRIFIYGTRSLHCPKHLHHLPLSRKLYHLLLRPVTSHLLRLLGTSIQLSAPEKQHAGLYPPKFQQYVTLSISYFPLARIKVINVFEMAETSQPSTVSSSDHYGPLSPSPLGLFSLVQQHWWL